MPSLTPPGFCSLSPVMAFFQASYLGTSDTGLLIKARCACACWSLFMLWISVCFDSSASHCDIFKLDLIGPRTITNHGIESLRQPKRNQYPSSSTNHYSTAHYLYPKVFCCNAQDLDTAFTPWPPPKTFICLAHWNIPDPLL
ncbi:hypothetical protein LY78DRAFT_29684 [Colletotrichum sublineola]|nr:hypothetical protein LY78DRAFT_29684 [Colletotrichum sublineola]